MTAFGATRKYHDGEAPQLDVRTATRVAKTRAAVLAKIARLPVVAVVATPPRWLRSLRPPTRLAPGKALIALSQVDGLPCGGPSVVYAIAGPGGEVKFGTTTDLRKRLKTLQAHSPVRLECVGWFPGGAGEEREIHGCLRGSRMHGEWFRASAEVREFTANFTAERLQVLAAELWGGEEKNLGFDTERPLPAVPPRAALELGRSGGAR